MEECADRSVRKSSLSSDEMTKGVCKRCSRGECEESRRTVSGGMTMTLGGGDEE